MENKKSNFIEKLKTARNISRACKESGIGRSTVYEWLAEDKEFKSNVRIAQDEAKMLICDLAEDNILKAIEEGDISISKYYLERHHSEYMPNAYKRVIKPWEAPKEKDVVESFMEGRAEIYEALMQYHLKEALKSDPEDEKAELAIDEESLTEAHNAATKAFQSSRIKMGPGLEKIFEELRDEKSMPVKEEEPEQKKSNDTLWKNYDI